MSTKDIPGDAPKAKKRFKTAAGGDKKLSRLELDRKRMFGLKPESATTWARRAQSERSRRTQERLAEQREERIAQAIRRVRSIFSTLQLAADEQTAVLRSLLDERIAPDEAPGAVFGIFGAIAPAREPMARVEPDSPPLPLPATAPEQWSEREGRKENPVKFIRRVYGPWLGRGLMRAHLRELDQPLYRAYAVWLHRNPDDVIAELPDVADVTDSLIAQLPDNVDLDLVRRVGLALHHRKSRHAPDEEK